MNFTQQKTWLVFVALALLITAVHSTLPEEDKVVGWQPNPNRRGALSILESCIFTIIACTWSIQHLNVPAPWETAPEIRWRRIRHALMTLLMPEIVLAHAIVERAAAIQSLKELRDAEIEDLEVCYVPWSWRRSMSWLRQWLRRTLICRSGRVLGSEEVPAQNEVEIEPARVKWSLLHSYYANMGGLRLGTEQGENVFGRGFAMPTIAITTRQFIYLRKKGSINATPTISEEEIKDKSTAGYFTKGLAVIQISSLILSLIGRAARHLATSQLEIITIAFVSCAIATYCFAWNKPQSVNTATTILTPKVDDLGILNMIIELQPQRLDGLLMCMPGVPKTGPMLNRIRNGSIEISNGYLQPVSLWLTVTVVLFGAIHLTAWNFTFPSSTERTLWRVGSTAITAFPTYLLLSSTSTSAFRGMQEEVQAFENSLFSLWAGYVDSTTPEGFPRFCYPSLSSLAEMIAQNFDGEKEIAAFRIHMAERNIGPVGRIQVEHFEWLLNQFVLPYMEKEIEWGDLDHALRTSQLIVRLRERTGKTTSFLEKGALAWNASGYGIFVVLILGMI